MDLTRFSLENGYAYNDNGILSDYWYFRIFKKSQRSSKSLKRRIRSKNNKRREIHKIIGNRNKFVEQSEERRSIGDRSNSLFKTIKNNNKAENKTIIKSTLPSSSMIKQAFSKRFKRMNVDNLLSIQQKLIKKHLSKKIGKTRASISTADQDKEKCVKNMIKRYVECIKKSEHSKSQERINVKPSSNYSLEKDSNISQSSQGRSDYRNSHYSKSLCQSWTDERMNKTFLKHRSELSTSYDFIYESTSHGFNESKDRFLQKNLMDFPNYSKKASKNFMDKYKSFTFKQRKRKSVCSENPFKLKNLSLYQNDFLSESSKCKDEIVVIKAIAKAGVDLRVIHFMRTYFEKLYGDLQTIPIEDFKKIWCSLIGHSTALQYPSLLQKLIHVLLSEDKEDIDLHKLDKFNHICEYLNVTITKNKNESGQIQIVLNPNENKTRKIYLKKSKINQNNQEELDSVIQLLWIKISQKFNKISEAFRFFDPDNNTTVNKREFREGLERLKISIPALKLENKGEMTLIDINSIFGTLDTHHIGYLTYKDFCKHLGSSHPGF
ncbi:unnamed protein product [Moneuplotes crassus]|uniref:EF-hand domain-containing protein n=1 Tax=Euplotes crassus TaxID=5936 RepID=A0AAD1U8D3_EUPCR|nr:unnamed protein product [Moneuplotes crassus]